MRRTLALTALLLAAVEAAAAPQVPGGYSYYKSLTLDHTVPGSTLSSFPVLVVIDEDSDLGGHARSDGKDIRFRLDGSSTDLDHEIESYAVAAGTATGIIHLNVPTVSVVSDTVVYAFYDGTTNYYDSSTPSGTWNANYEAVWHLSDLDDSTANGHTLSNSGATSGGTGEIGDCYTFADGDYLYVSDPVCADPPVTLTAWFKRTDSTNYRRRTILAVIDSDDKAHYILAAHRQNSEASQHVNMDHTSDTSGTSRAEIGDWSVSTWHHGAGWFAGGTGSDKLKAFLDASGSTDSNYQSSSGHDAFRIGSASGYNGFVGSIDEARVSSVTLTDDWIAYEHANRPSNWSTYAAWGSEQSASSGLPPRLVGERSSLVNGGLVR